MESEVLTCGNVKIFNIYFYDDLLIQMTFTVAQFNTIGQMNFSKKNHYYNETLANNLGCMHSKI